MKRLCLSLLLAVISVSLWSQTPLADDESTALMAQLTEKAASMQAMQCRFVQTKTMAMLAEPSVSEGTMLFYAPDRLRWEYLTPDSFVLIVDSERIVKETDGKEEVMSGKAGRMVQGIVSIIMDSASGKKLFDVTAFDVTLFDDNDCWKAEMAPKRRDLKHMFGKLVFFFSKDTQYISHVEFVEAGGDVTSIRFEDIKVNEAVGEWK